MENKQKETRTFHTRLHFHLIHGTVVLFSSRTWYAHFNKEFGRCRVRKVFFPILL